MSGKLRSKMMCAGRVQAVHHVMIDWKRPPHKRFFSSLVFEAVADTALINLGVHKDLCVVNG